MVEALPSGDFGKERAGVLAVAAEMNRLGLIWRETPVADVGIDGQIEFVNDTGQATGRLVAAQVKSGTSYFRDGGEEWRFRPQEKHRFYWERFPLPVLLFLHSPAVGTFWADVRQALRRPGRGRLPYVGVPKHRRLQDATRAEFLSSVGVSGRPFLPVENVLQHLSSIRSPDRTFPLTYLDLFANGLTNSARSVYFGMDLATEVAEAAWYDDLEAEGFGVGAPEHDFLFGYVSFLVEQQIADIDVSHWLIDWIDQEIHPTFIAPLTSRGREVVHLINDWQRRLEAAGRLKMPPGIALAQETFVRMRFTEADFARMPLIRRFGELLLTGMGPDPLDG